MGRSGKSCNDWPRIVIAGGWCLAIYVPDRVAGEDWLTDSCERKERNSYVGTLTGVNSYRYDAFQYGIFRKCHVNEHRATLSWKQSLRKSERLKVVLKIATVCPKTVSCVLWGKGLQKTNTALKEWWLVLCRYNMCYLVLKMIHCFGGSVFWYNDMSEKNAKKPAIVQSFVVSVSTQIKRMPSWSKNRDLRRLDTIIL